MFNFHCFNDFEVKLYSLVFRDMDDFKARWQQVSNILNLRFSAGKTIQLDFRAEVRSAIDNAKLHAILSPINKHGVFDIRRDGYKVRVYCNEFDDEKFKTFMVAYFCEEMESMGEPLENGMRDELNPFTGKMTQIRPTTTKWSKDIVNKFCLCMQALMAESLNPIPLSKHEQEAYEEYAKRS